MSGQHLRVGITATIDQSDLVITDLARAIDAALVIGHQLRLPDEIEIEIDGAVDDGGDAVLSEQIEIARALLAGDVDIDAIKRVLLVDEAELGKFGRRLRLRLGFLADVQLLSPLSCQFAAAAMRFSEIARATRRNVG